MGAAVTNVVITCLLNAFPDPQYGGFWPADLERLSVIPTVHAHGGHVVVLHDCLELDSTDDTTFVRVDSDVPNAYFARWGHVADYLANTTHELVWCVDGGDVRMLNDPFPWMAPGVLYVGSEPCPDAVRDARSVGFWWVRQYHPDHGEWIAANTDRLLLNGGLLGGDAATVRRFAEEVAAAWPTRDGTDMAAVNRIAYSSAWLGRFVTGDRVHTPMWSFRLSDRHAWWAHK